jgi:hypothetical protein
MEVCEGNQVFFGGVIHVSRIGRANGVEFQASIGEAAHEKRTKTITV